MNSPWTALGTPAISIPLPVGSGLPLGLQLTADHGQDARLLGQRYCCMHCKRQIEILDAVSLPTKCRHIGVLKHCS
jgi:hypothetical protein